MRFLVLSNLNTNINLLFIPGWNNTFQNIIRFANLFKEEYSTYIYTPTPFIDRNCKVFNIDDFINELDTLIKENNLKNLFIIGHSFGGKLAFLYKLKNNEINVIALAPSIYKNSFSLKVYIKIKLYKIFRFLKIRIPFFLKGSKDYKMLSGKLKQTFINVHHFYLSDKELLKIDKALIIGYKYDNEVKCKVLKKVNKINNRIKLEINNGGHFGHLEDYKSVYFKIRKYLNEKL